jgi:hypothetical protein
MQRIILVDSCEECPYCDLFNAVHFCTNGMISLESHDRKKIHKDCKLDQLEMDDEQENQEIVCDRCGAIIEDGFRDESGMTAGFYDVTGTAFKGFANPGEKDVCDNCMHKDPRYIAEYGNHI